MITIGCTTWSGHPLFTDKPNNPKSKSTLSQYTNYLPTTEVDMPFYYVPKLKVVKNWQQQVPKNFQFIIKANRRLTKQDYNQHITPQQRYQTLQDFVKSVQPLVKTNQLKTILLQFPQFFKYNQFNLNYLKQLRHLMPKLPLSVEFRSPTWYANRNLEIRVAKLLASLKMTEVVVDEPHNQYDGVPFIPTITNHNLILIRLHGRNAKGWFSRQNNKNWRKTRTLYCYSHQELVDLANLVKNLSHDAKEVCIIFNNNSAKDAAPNAMELKKLLKLKS